MTETNDIADEFNSHFVNQPKDLLDAQNIDSDTPYDDHHDTTPSEEALQIPNITQSC